jgi:hypothetical protein
MAKQDVVDFTPAGAVGIESEQPKGEQQCKRDACAEADKHPAATDATA